MQFNLIIYPIVLCLAAFIPSIYHTFEAAKSAGFLLYEAPSVLDGNLTSVRFESLVGVEVIMDPLPVSSTCLPNAYDGVLAHIEVCSTNHLVFLGREVTGSP